MDRPLQRLFLLDDAPVDPCVEIRKKAASYYKNPPKDMDLKAPLEKLYEVADVEEPIGIWVANVPRPGDVLGCYKPNGRAK